MTVPVSVTASSATSSAAACSFTSSTRHRPTSPPIIRPVRRELKAYGNGIEKKKEIVALSKCDALDEATLAERRDVPEEGRAQNAGLFCRPSRVRASRKRFTLSPAKFRVPAPPTKKKTATQRALGSHKAFKRIAALAASGQLAHNHRALTPSALPSAPRNNRT